MSAPREIFRHIGKLEYVEDLIIQNELTFSSPTLFNDPFDCKTTFTYEGVTKQTMRDHLFFMNKKLNPELNDMIIYAKIDELLEKEWPFPTEIFEEDSKILEHVLNESTKPLYLCCFSETNDDILMWSHYSDKHKGFCLQFDSSALQSDSLFKLHPVDYRDSYPTVQDFVDLQKTGNDIPDSFQMFLLSKSDHWEYEKEWRAVAVNEHETNNLLKCKIPQGALTGIIFGCDCPPDIIKKISSLTNLHHPSVKLQKAVKNKHQYALDILDILDIEDI